MSSKDAAGFIASVDLSPQFKAMAAPSKIDPATAILDRFGHSKKYLRYPLRTERSARVHSVAS